jgi:hypothetical protein
MSSRSSSESISKDIGVLVKAHNRLTNNQRELAKATRESLESAAELLQDHENRIRKQAKALMVLTLSVAVQAIYLIIML